MKKITLALLISTSLLISGCGGSCNVCPVSTNSCCGADSYTGNWW